MRLFTSYALWTLAILAGLSTANAAVASDSSQCLAEICGEPLFGVESSLVARSTPQKPCPSATATLKHRDLTNAERLGRGLPLKPPVRRGHAARSQVSPIPQVPEPEEPEPPTTEPEPKEVVYQGKIEVRKTDGTSLGYIYATNRASGLFTYGTVEGSALTISFSLNEGVTSGTNLAITMLNSDGPLLGLVQGRDSTTVDIATGSFNYLYINGIELPGSSPGSVPITMPNGYSSNRAAESHIWNLDLTTGDLSPQWINSDGSSPVTKLWSQSNFLYAGADPAAFLAKYPSAVTPLTLHFVVDDQSST
ncbi:hypothetical protein JR316_0002609 [Psilocybe cubensis]|uniref:Uncharacterized protein n=2 Tax=Psilocybe cubensis TaxID=181762 RepID=A0ACB8HDL0_PSICU|nr:hypothetical protein JR316_0002609 [Psilocybe cubensis]KAH9485697.1 hypothetical protein JR316_0002609 [Psilocybe cubensis]